MPEPQTLPGAQFEPPPLEHLPSVTASIEKAVATLPPTARGAIVTVANRDGANAAVVIRAAGGAFQVVGWVGKRWTGPLDYGAYTRVAW